LVGEQENSRLELACFLDRIRLGRHVALHRAVLVGQERLRVERVGLHLVGGKAAFGLHPFEEGLLAIRRDEQCEGLEVVEDLRLRSGMRKQDLRILLEDRRDRD
jgi:hypothetical protein